MFVDNGQPHLSADGAAIRARYRDGADGRLRAERLEPLVRSLAEEAHAAGLTAERAIVLLKLTVFGSSAGALPLLVTEDDRREHRLFETMIGWVLDEYFGQPQARPA